MSRRWLLSLLYLLVTCLVLLQITSARGEFKVDESRTKVLLQSNPTAVQLSIENSLVEIPSARVRLELLNPLGGVVVSSEQMMSVALGKQTLALSLPFDLSRLKPQERRLILCYRLHYVITNAPPPEKALAEGIASLSQIAPDLFSVRVGAAQFAREGMLYRSRVQTFQPVTEKPVGGVRVDAVVTLETDDEGNGVKIPASGVTDSSGYATLSFALPARFPEFPHQLRPSGGSIQVTARRGALVAEAENDVLVDQFPRVVISTDKPLYQPGQVLHLRALTFSPARHALANQTVNFRIKDPEGTLVFRDSATSSRFGIGSIDWPIPENTRLGDYLINVSLGDDDDSSNTGVRVRISRYDLPNFSVKTQANQAYYVAGQNAEVKVSADYLFGEPVKRGRVRVVRETSREWNYREQKWDIEEGDKYEGETDADGVFVAHVSLDSDHAELRDETYARFRDITYAAYFTDPTTNRTEQRRFDLRVTKEPIHVYVIDGQYNHSYKLPLEFYVSTYYADGTPASCKVTLGLADDDDKLEEDTRKATRPLATVRTNRYGLAKISSFRAPDDSDLELKIVARDGRGKTGSATEEFNVDDSDEIRVTTDKRLYQPGEPIALELTSTVPDLTAIVDVAGEANILSSQKVRMYGGRASLIIPGKSEFKDKLTVAAYADFAETSQMISTRGILFPRKQELQVDAQPAEKTYRPGDEAQVSFRIRAPGGQPTVAALGLAIVDKAVDERFRTDQESGNRSSGFYGSAAGVFGYDEAISGVSLRDLQRLDMSRPVSPELELAAAVLLDQNQSYYPRFFKSDSFETTQVTVFRDIIRSQLAGVRFALATRYEKTREYPTTEARLQTLLAESGIDLTLFRDPWGKRYDPVFYIDGLSDVLSFASAGADKRFDTTDDFSIESMRWAYFRPVGEAMDRAVREYHARTGEFIRDFVTLRTELAKVGFDLGSMRDRWGEPYRFDFSVAQVSFVIKVTSSGPDKKFSTEQYYRGDDFDLWTSSIDYFAERRSQIDAALNAELTRTNSLPQNNSDLYAVLRSASVDPNALNDAWGHRLYSVFSERQFFGNRVRIETRAKYGEANQARTDIKPVTLRAVVISLRSSGPDGEEGTSDDFNAVEFSRNISEQSSQDLTPKPLALAAGFLGDTGGITGVVMDQAGASIAGAAISAKQSSSLLVFETTSDDEGRFILRNLPPGEYEVRATAAGFKSLVMTTVPVTASNVTELNLQLEPGAVSEAVNITDAGEQTQTTQSQASVAGRENAFSIDGIKNSSVRRNLNTKFRLVTKSGTGYDETSTPRLREYFPETLLWQPSLETDSRGRAQLKFKLADNITTWRMSVLGSTENGEIGMAETEIKSFQPFFVELEPPRILTEGDRISLPIVVRNYLERAQTVDLEMKPESWFTLLGPARQRVNVGAGEAARQTFDLRAVASVKDGKQRVTASGAEASDAIEKPVTVHPDGEEKTQTAGDLLVTAANLNIDVPAAVLPGSTQAEIKIYPNLMAHVTESIAGILERPYGCGEQTISSTYPSLLWLRHNKQRPDSRLSNKTERYAALGYQRLLNYRDENGGFTYWGRGPADIALTAYALRFLHDVAEFVPVDDEVVQGARQWLIKQQRPDGSWPALEHYSERPENERRTALLTAFVARVLALTARPVKMDAAEPQAAKAEVSAGISPELKRALAFVAPKIDEIDEPYLIAAYALAAADAGDADGAARAAAKLRALAHTEGNTSYWTLETNTPFYGWGLAGRVETTALAVQALARQSKTESGQAALNPDSADPLVRRGLLFLLRSKDRYGVWYSTQATINVLDALVSLLRNDAPPTPQPAAPAATGEVVEVVINGQPAVSLKVDGDGPAAPIRADVSRFLLAGANRIELRRAASSAGAQVASAQLVASYYVPWSQSAAPEASSQNAASSLRLSATFDKTSAKVTEEISCRVKAERVGYLGYGMMLAEIGLPPGADVDRASLDTAMVSSGWTISQYDVLPDRVVVYLWAGAGGVDFSFKFRPRFALTGKNAPSVVYDYYNPEARAVVAPTTFLVR